jgi:hypothetical protein
MFVYCRSKRHGAVYVAASEIVQVDATAEEVITRDGLRHALVLSGDVDRLLGDGVVRGVSIDDGKIVAVPLSSIDHVTDEFDGDEWQAVATTKRGVRLLLDAPSRSALGMDSEICDLAGLRSTLARMRGDDEAARAAVEAAEAAAGASKVAVG